jgi:CheY-like chemotaxis protein
VSEDGYELNVLVIDDQPEIRELLAEFLEVLGHAADLAEDGRDGLVRFDPRVHQAVITDFLMPKMTGFEVAEAIRARGCATPIVMLSGHTATEDEQRAVELGMRFVRKPVTLATFEAAMAEVVLHAIATP